MSKITDVGAHYSPQFVKVEVSNKLREAAQAALLALKCLDGLECAREEIENLEAALAEPAIKDSLTVAEQKPMLEMNPEKREWVGLTDDEIWQEWSSPKDSAIDFARTIEAKLREKNT